MKVNIVVKKEWTYGWPINYISSLKLVSNGRVIYLKNRYTNLPMSNWLQDYIFNPIKVRQTIEDGIIHFVDPYYGHYLYLLKNEKTVVTCHDIYHTVVGDYRGFNKFFYDLSIRGMTRADKIIADSEHTKKDIIKYLKYPEEKIKVVPLGVDLNNFKEIALEKDLKHKYILHVGSEVYKGRKNVYGLIKAFYKLKKRIPEIKMIQVGVPKGIYAGIVQQLGLQDDIKFYGIVSNNELLVLYNKADIFVFPSLYEGFGLPPLEAMACGCPVVTSNTSSLPELIGDAGIMVDPYNVDGLVEAMYKVLTNDGLRQTMVKLGLERVKRFTWERTARETYKVYEEVWNDAR